MIELLRGILVEKSANHLLVDVNGVGYGVSAPTRTTEAVGEVGSEVELWIRTYVREDTLRLFGFATRQEREVFDVFLKLSGVGPGIGLAMLSTLSIRELVVAVSSNDSRPIRAVKGIGPKLAEKLILELKDKVAQFSAHLPPEELATEGAPVLETESARDAEAALEALGVTPVQARRAVAKALEILGEAATVQELVREGLKHRRSG